MTDMRRLFVCLILVIAPLVLRADPAFWQHEFPLTDFGRSDVAWTEILSGGPPRDGIPALDHPAFVSVSGAGIPDREPVMVLDLPGAPARAYPLRYLLWHEIVNDTVAGRPVAVTFCPLCNSAVVFDRRHKGRVLTFGVTGKLRASDIVMYDRENESWWQQAIGVGIVGEYTGGSLKQIASWTLSMADFESQYPEGLVMAAPRVSRQYGVNPYAGYDSRDRPYPFFKGEMPPHGIAALARVIRVGNRAYPLARLAPSAPIVDDHYTITWEGRMASALGAPTIAEAADVAAIRVRDPEGRDIPHDVMFAFAFHALYPDGHWRLD